MTTPTHDPLTIETPPTPPGGKGSRQLQHQRGLIRARKALELRALGLSFERIAEECGYANRSGAQKAVQRALADSPPSEGKEQLRALETEHLLSLRRTAMARLGKRDSRENGAPYVNALVRISERIARLHGLDAPLKHVVTSELDEEIDNLMADLAATPAVPVEEPAP